MKTPRIVNAVGHIDDELVSEAADGKKTAKNRAWLKFLPVAACFALIVSAIVIIPTFREPKVPIIDDPIDTTKSAVESTTADDSTTVTDDKPADTDEITSSPPPQQSFTQTFENIRAMKKEIDEKRNNGSPSSLYASSNIDTSDLKELKGLNTDYKESWVEWSGDDTYVIYYTTMDSVLAFMPFSSENSLQKNMESWLLSDGTYENLLANHLVSDVEFTNLPTTIGTSYQCTYNTGRVTGLILRYHTYTHPESNITYILSETFSPDNQLQSKSLFVFDGDKSFMCNGNDVSLTISTACNLYSSTIQ